MSRVALLLVLPIVFGCAKKDAPAADTAAVAPPAPVAAAPAPMNVAGKWMMTVMAADKDTTLLTYTLDATNDQTGWKMTLPGRPAMDLRITAMSSDSIVVDNGPYSSALRKNVMVTTHSNMHMEGDKLVGATVAHYNTKGADSVVNLRVSGSRSQ